MNYPPTPKAMNWFYGTFYKTLDIMYETPMTDKLKRLLGDKSEGYWYSLVNDDPSDSTKVKLCMLNEAPLEKW